MSFQRRLRRSRRTFAAFTLIEMMISLVITLGMVYAMVEVFARIGKQTTESRAVIEMLGQIRSARYRLEQDLKGITVPLQPWIDADASPGYFELIEGVGRDNLFILGDQTQPHLHYLTKPDQSTTTPDLRGFVTTQLSGTDTVAINAASLMGDVDDVIAFTVRSNGEPFRGRFNGTLIESNLAEIIWWSELNDTNGNGVWDHDRNETFRIHRRVLLIRPDLNNSNDICHIDTMAGGNAHAKRDFQHTNDISVRNAATPAGVTGTCLAANSLRDLSFHKNRVGRYDNTNASTGLNGSDLTSPMEADKLPIYPTNSDQYGDDVVLANVLAFDFRVYDPNAPVVFNYPTKLSAGQTSPTNPEEVLMPGDVGYNATQDRSLSPKATVARYGAFVDLGELVTSDLRTWLTPLSANSASNSLPASGIYENQASDAALIAGSSHFLGQSNANARILSNPLVARVYDTWPLQYEKDGKNQDGDALTDEGTNGLDDDDINGVDDPGERETSPPYAHPLRGLQVKIRMLEGDTRQVRQSSFSLSFVQD